MRAPQTQGMIGYSSVGLALGIGSLVLLSVPVAAAVLGAGAAACAAVGILGSRGAPFPGRLVLIFSAFAFASLFAALAGGTGSLTWIVVGAASYLVGAIAYGFAAAVQAVSVRARIGLLLLLLLAVIPIVSLLGIAGIFVTALVRRR